MKRVLLLLSVIIILISFSVASSAHSGRTDGAGGHNVAGGGYHYHHGYPAHDHYDKDGDGIAEYCPYRINDNTQSTKGSAQIKKPIIEKPITKKATTSTTAKTTKLSESKSDTKNNIIILFFSIIISLIPIAIIFVATAAFIIFIEQKNRDLSEKIEAFITQKSTLLVLWIISIIVVYLLITALYK